MTTRSKAFYCLLVSVLCFSTFTANSFAAKPTKKRKPKLKIKKGGLKVKNKRPHILTFLSPKEGATLYGGNTYTFRYSCAAKVRVDMHATYHPSASPMGLPGGVLGMTIDVAKNMPSKGSKRITLTERFFEPSQVIGSSDVFDTNLTFVLTAVIGGKKITAERKVKLIAPKLEITKPVYKETLRMGRRYVIRWKARGAKSKKVRLILSQKMATQTGSIEDGVYETVHNNAGGCYLSIPEDLPREPYKPFYLEIRPMWPKSRFDPDYCNHVQQIKLLP